MKKNNKEALLHLPTPLEYLPNLSLDLGIDLYIKRDDLTGLGVGGNKLRKLEYFLHVAKSKGATMLITVGGAQTNHGRLTAAVAAKYGMKCAIIAIDDYPGEISANILLDRIMGSDVILHRPDGTELMDVVAEYIAIYEARGETVYFIPMGGSDELGALGYFDCGQELVQQTGGGSPVIPQVGSGRLIVAVGSMGTYMGLFCGLHGSGLQLTGILIGDFYEDVKSYALDYFNRCRIAWGLNFTAEKNDFDIREQYLFGGYNIPSKEVRESIYHMARKEAIILDPCYTGKTFAGLSDLVRKGEIRQGEKVIFLHTGGLPGINTPVHRTEMERELSGGVTIL